MGEILSQEEIDALLQDLASGDNVEVEAKNQKDSQRIPLPYNFARPSKFSKEQLRTLEVIFEAYARSVTSFLTGYIRSQTSLEVVSSEQLTYGEFSNSIVNPVILGIIDFSPLKGSILLDLSSHIGYAIIDRILGGAGETVKKVREFTEIEIMILIRIVSQMINLLSEPWRQVYEIYPELTKVETNAQFAQFISPNEMVALITINIKSCGVEGLINFCIPHLVIEPIMDRLNTKQWFSISKEEDSEKYRSLVEKNLDDARLPVSVVIGRTNITVDEFIDIQVGDVITLDSFVNSDFIVKVGELNKFYAKPGVHRGRNSVKVTSIIRKEE